MGFEVPDNKIQLAFADPSLKGLEVECQLATLDQVTEAAQLASIDPKNITTEDANHVEHLIQQFADAVVSWNCTRNGKKIPTTRKGVSSLDPVFTMQLVEAWLSNSGKLLAEQSKNDAEIAEGLDMEPLGS